MDKKVFLSLVAFIVVFSAYQHEGQQQAKAQQKHPNIIFILADDLGWGDVGFNNPEMKDITPNIDRLASEGMIFTDAYAAPVCSPTRAALLSGRYPASLNMTAHIPGWGDEKYRKIRNYDQNTKLLDAESINQLPLEEITFAEILQEAGYVTGFFGKWHLAGDGSLYSEGGMVDDRFHPEHQGFDINIGGNAYGKPHSWFDPFKNATISSKKEGQYLTDRLGDEVISFLEEKRNVPFLVYLSTYVVHTPLQAKPEAKEKAGGVYEGMIYTLDQNVGRILRALKDLGLSNNTVVVFYSDNGGLGSNAPWRGHKGQLYEGGIRVPLAVRWPGKIPAGSKSSEPVIHVDFYPTLLDIVGIDPLAQQELEGESLVRLLLQKEETLQRNALFWHFPHYRDKTGPMGSAIRSGAWKLIERYDDESFELYNLANDPRERKNLIKVNPEKTKELYEKMLQWKQQAKAPMPMSNPRYKEKMEE